MVLSHDDLVEIRTLMSLGWTQSQIFEHRVGNAYRGERHWKKTTLRDAFNRIKVKERF
jgi:hypothetical protein